MNKKYLVLSLFLILPILANAQEKLNAGWELWYPYQYHNNKNQLIGLDIESFDAILSQANINYSITELPWKRHLMMIKAGHMDIAMGASKTSEREEYAYFSLPYRKELVNLVVKRGDTKRIKLNTLADLSDSDYLIGVESGYYYGEQYAKLITKKNFHNNISEVIDIEENVKQLNKGHIDGFLVDPITLKAFVKKYKLDGQFEIHPLTIYQDDIYIMLSKKSTSTITLDKINNAIKHLKSNGKLKEISNKWSKING
ncbi:amino acid ABC transporter substrate-binding protein [Thalassotalea sp. M1531]|uniref:Amino acid ABC transporter substrate-binding protein n=1 Tax=Thalassotalea algicola TaxID=2716224 RepID=A0A7Y0LDM3_9GAMM|nr:transporter substrate-binding domain-containing protein [Thalassotalea algicola]NMP32347.1 amino acid ABC transporter substrate-binding protein [Thalassotalea algicola]